MNLRIEPLAQFFGCYKLFDGKDTIAHVWSNRHDVWSNNDGKDISFYSNRFTLEQMQQIIDFVNSWEIPVDNR